MLSRGNEVANSTSLSRCASPESTPKRTWHRNSEQSSVAGVKHRLVAASVQTNMCAASTTEVGWHHEPAALGRLSQNRRPRPVCLLRIGADGGRQSGLDNLERTVHRVSAKDGAMASIVDDKPHLAVSVAR